MWFWTQAQRPDAGRTRPHRARSGVGYEKLWMADFAWKSADSGHQPIKSSMPPVKYAQTACESTTSGFDAVECGDYVMRS
jgi:hypothetical protein